MEPEVPDFCTDYLSHVLLSGHSDSFRKFDKKLFSYTLPTSALTSGTFHVSVHMVDIVSLQVVFGLMFNLFIGREAVT